MRKKRFLLGAVALTAALAATGCGGTNGSQAADNAKTQVRIPAARTQAIKIPASRTPAKPTRPTGTSPAP